MTTTVTRLELPAIALVTALTVWGLLEQQTESVINFLQRILPTDMVAQPRDYRTAFWTAAELHPAR